MEKFKITFWIKPLYDDDPFIKNSEPYLTSANITKSTFQTIESYHVQLDDIGMNSLFGEFEIIRENGNWQTSDQDSQDLNSLKWNIIEKLMLELE